jgi:hypothetical protein
MEIFSINPGQIYYHFKRDPEKGVEHGSYLVLGLGINTENRNLIYVVTKPLYFCEPRQCDEKGISYLLRPIEFFVDKIYRENFKGERFVLITDESVLNEIKSKPLFNSEFLDE